MNTAKRLNLILSIFILLLMTLLVFQMRTISQLKQVPVIEPVQRSFLIWFSEEETRDPEARFRTTLFVGLLAAGGSHERKVVKFWDHESQPTELRGTTWLMEHSELWYYTKAGGDDAQFPASWRDEIAPKGARLDPADIQGKVLRIRQVSKAEDSIADGNLWCVDETSPQSVSVYIGMASFQNNSLVSLTHFHCSATS